MPLVKLSFRPGINKESTSYANEGGYYDCNWVRFRSGYPEKIGGWQNISYSNSFKGIARSLWPWVTFTAEKLCGIGTSQKYYIEHGGQYYDITPVRTTVTLTPSGLGNTLKVDAADLTLRGGNLALLPDGILGTAVETAILPVAGQDVGITSDSILTIDGSRIVTIQHNAHGASAGTYVQLTSTETVGGLSINGEYEIITTTPNSYTIDAGDTATATATGGGTVTAEYDISVGNALYIGPPTSGWGIGPFGFGTWGYTELETIPTVLYSFLQLWSQCNYGEDLIIAPRGGTLYYWDFSAARQNTPWSKAVTLASKTNSLGKLIVSGVAFSQGANSITIENPLGITAGCVVSGTGIDTDTYVTTSYDGGISIPLSKPTVSQQTNTILTFSYAGRFVPNRTEYVLSADTYQFIICLGANPYNPTNFSTAYDPMLVRWASQDNVYEWTPDTQNQAGEQRLTTGSYLVCGRNTRQEILIWSDAALYSMQYLGPANNVFGFTLLSDNISIASQNAVTITNNTVFWMGKDKFYVYTGRVDTVPCTLHEYVFGDINRNRMNQVVSGSNEGFNEIWWFYPSANSTVNDRYVIYNYIENVWYHGNITRTVWYDSPLYDGPRAAFSTQATYLAPTDDPEQISLTPEATEIVVMNADSFPDSGTVVIENEEISYSGKSGDKLLNCVRGVNNTTITSAKAYTAVRFKTPNQLMQHETGTDDKSQSVPEAINSYITSSDFDIGDGHDFGFVWRILPDLTFDGSTSELPQVNLFLGARINSGTNYTSYSEPNVQLSSSNPEQYTGYPVTPLNRGQVYTRVRGRQMRLIVESDDVGVNWKLGQMRIDIRPDGRRA